MSYGEYKQAFDQSEENLILNGLEVDSEFELDRRAPDEVKDNFESRAAERNGPLGIAEEAQWYQGNDHGVNKAPDPFQLVGKVVPRGEGAWMIQQLIVKHKLSKQERCSADRGSYAWPGGLLVLLAVGHGAGEEPTVLPRGQERGPAR